MLLNNSYSRQPPSSTYVRRALKAEAQNSEQATLAHSLQNKLQEQEAREVDGLLKRERLACERDKALNRVGELESKEDAMTLSITKESNRDLNVSFNLYDDERF
jgi:hypothetical protein